MKRYVLVPVITRDDPDLGTYRDLDIPDGVNATKVIPDVGDMGLAIIGGKNLVPVLARTGIISFPDVPKDMRWSAVHQPTRETFVAKLKAKGVNTAFIADADGFREVIRTIGRALDPNFHEDAFDCSDN